MRALIIDDEEDLRVVLKKYLHKYLPSIKVEGMADGVNAGVELIESKVPDVIFLDFEMKDGTGFDLLDQLTIKPKVIFITAHSEHALKAFRYSAIDYLLKPIDPLELVEAVNKVLDLDRPNVELDALRSNLTTKQPNSLVLRDQNNIYLVKLDQVMYCKSENYYTTFYLSSGEKYVVSKPLKYYAQQLKDEMLRVHQSFLVNFNFVKKLDKREGGILCLLDGSEIPISSRKRDAVIQYMNSLS